MMLCSGNQPFSLSKKHLFEENNTRYFICSMLRAPLISLSVHAKWSRVCSWNKWCFLCWICLAWTQGMSEQWLGETSSLGAPGWGDPCFGAVWGEWRLPGVSARQGEHLPLLHLKSCRPRAALPQNPSLSTSSEHLPPLEKHPCFVPKPHRCSLDPLIETKSSMFKLLRCIFKSLYWTKKKYQPKIWWYKSTWWL